MSKNGGSLFKAPLSVFGFNEKAHSDSHGTKCEDVSLTRQSEREDADINTIVRRFGITGQMPTNMPPLMYGDFSDIGDYQSAFAAVADAQERFMSMPAEVRSRFANDPQKFLEFCEDGRNLDEARKLGLLIEVKKDPGPVKVEVVNPAVPK